MSEPIWLEPTLIYLIGATVTFLLLNLILRAMGWVIGLPFRLPARVLTWAKKKLGILALSEKQDMAVTLLPVNFVGAVIYYLLQLALIGSYTMVLQVRFPWMTPWFGLYALIWAGVVVGLRGFLTVMAGLFLLWWIL